MRSRPLKFRAAGCGIMNAVALQLRRCDDATPWLELRRSSGVPPIGPVFAPPSRNDDFRRFGAQRVVTAGARDRPIAPAPGGTRCRRGEPEWDGGLVPLG